MKNFMFTSESVTEGHPDKLCDIISDAVIDHFLSQDPKAKVRAECALSSAIIFIATRFASTANIDFTRLTRKVIKQVGYDQPEFNAMTCSILTSPKALPIDESRGFDEHRMSDKEISRIAARNQVTVFGFACNHTHTFMPMPVHLARLLSNRLTSVRQGKRLPYLMPDGNVQVGVEYRDKKPFRVHSVTVNATQLYEHRPPMKTLTDDIRQWVVEPVFKESELALDEKTRILINPNGHVLGGPVHHSGQTGRKNAVDTYGQYARHGGRALSGKDPMRIDRSGAYAARYAAKNIVAAGLAEECEVMLSYSIGLTKPVSLVVRTFGTGKHSDEELTALTEKCFDFRLAAILRRFDLRYLPSKNPGGFYQKLAASGHFGRIDMDLPWERRDRVEELMRSV